MEQLMTKRDVARVLGISMRTIGYMMARKELPYVKVRGWAVRFRPEELRKYIQQQESATVA